jgi:hypothetical protein
MTALKQVLVIVDRAALPLSVSTHADSHHDVTLVQLSFDFYMLDAMHEHVIGGNAYDSETLHHELRYQGVDMIAPHRTNRKQKTQDGRNLQRYARRWLAESFVALVQWRRRLLVRREYYPAKFLDFELGALSMRLRAF